jgi:SAM-dependent methyltransferase
MDVWATGALYEPYVGRWSRLVAKDFVKWLSIPAQKDWLDVGCGTGALTQTVLEHCCPNTIRGIEPSSGFIEFAKTKIHSARVSFEIADAQSLPFEPACFDVVVCGLVLNFVPQPRTAVSEMARVARRGGQVAAYVWDYAGKMEMIRYFWDAAVALEPAALGYDEGRLFPICQPSSLSDLFKETGLKDVEVHQFDIPTCFRDFDDYWSPFLGGQGPAPGYLMSLSEERRDAFRDRIHACLPIAENGSIDLIARAWAVRGQASE